MKSSLEKMARNETGAREFLTRAGVLLSTGQCQLCGSTRVAPFGRGRNRCTDCGFTWSLRRGSIIENTHLTCVQFVRAVRLFADEVPPADAAERLRVDRTTVERLYTRIRLSLAGKPSGSGDGCGTSEDPAQTGEPTGAAAVRPAPVVFGIRSRHDTVAITQIVTDVPDIIIGMDIPWSIRNNILLIDACEKTYHGLIAYYPDRGGREVVLARPRNRGSWPPLAVFWRYARTSWSHHRYLSRGDIPAYLSELEFRYNHRHTDMFHAILSQLSGCGDRL